MLRNNLSLITIVLALTACAHTEPVIKVEIKEVEIPIATPCKADIPVPPDFKFKGLKVEDNIFDKTKTVLADRKLHLAYEDELLIALKSCTQIREKAP